MKATSNPKVSVVIPLYNAEKYIEKCLRSALEQTMDDIEVIVVDDVSTDASMDIVKKLAMEDDRIRYDCNTENSGAGVSRNKGIDMSRAESIFFMDADDWLEPKAFEIAYDALIQNEAQYVIFRAKFIDFDGKEIFIMGRNENAIITDKTEWLKGFLRYAHQDMVWTKLFSAKFIKENNIRFEPIYQVEDLVFNLSHYNFIEKVAVISDQLYNYRKCEGITFGKATEKNIDGMLKRLKAVNAFVCENDLMDTKEGLTLFTVAIDMLKGYMQRYAEGRENRLALDILVRSKVKEIFPEQSALIWALIHNDYNSYEKMTEMFHLDEQDTENFLMYKKVADFADQCLNDKRLLKQYSILIYSTGNWAKLMHDALKARDIDILGFVDSNEERWGKTFLEKPIYSPEKLKDMSFDKIIPASTYYKEIRESLLCRGIPVEKIAEIDFM